MLVAGRLQVADADVDAARGLQTRIHVVLCLESSLDLLLSKGRASCLSIYVQANVQMGGSGR